MCVNYKYSLHPIYVYVIYAITMLGREDKGTSSQPSFFES